MSRYSPLERRAVFSLAGLFSLRMVGLFMILPVFSVYGVGLSGATPFLIGLAVGAYGLAQLMLQIPFGLLADRYDRRRLILIGLALFALGGAIAAASSSIWGVIVGRFLQGSGAISAVVMALMSDTVREENRTKAMATVGMSIGVSFAVAFVLGPVLAHAVGLSGLFATTTLMGLAAMLIALRFVPRTAVAQRQLPVQYRIQLKSLLKHAELGRLNVGIFTLHLVMTACFVALPPLLVAAGLPVAQHGWLYLPVMLLAFVALIPAVIVAERQQRMKQVFLFAIAMLILAMLALSQAHGLTALIAAVSLFFFAFNLLEALLPSLVSKVSPAGSKGTAMGIYSSSQFLGAFLGGMLGGLSHSMPAGISLFWLLAAMVLLWGWRAAGMAQPRYGKSLMLKPLALKPLTEQQMAELHALAGVDAVVPMPDEALIFVKVVPKVWTYSALAGRPVKILPTLLAKL